MDDAYHFSFPVPIICYIELYFHAVEKETKIFSIWTWVLSM